MALLVASCQRQGSQRKRVILTLPAGLLPVLRPTWDCQSRVRSLSIEWMVIVENELG